MEKVGINWDKKTVISALTEGKEHANELKRQLHPSIISREDCIFLLEKVVSSYDNALSLLNYMGLLGNENPSQTSASNNNTSMLESPLSIEGSPRSEISEPDSKNQVHNKKRKTLPKWSELVRVCSGTGLDGQLDDGYNWRKYGQKDILGSTHPRAYYRCTHRHTQGCLATKQVQKTDEDSSVFEVIYKGNHSCMQERLKQNKESPKKQKMISSEPDLKVETQELEKKVEKFPSFSFLPTQDLETGFFSEARNFVGTSYSPQFLSPATSESYFSLSPCQVNDFGIGQNLQSSESDLAEIISNPTPFPNFPFGELDLCIDQAGFESHFLDASEYF